MNHRSFKGSLICLIGLISECFVNGAPKFSPLQSDSFTYKSPIATENPALDKTAIEKNYAANCHPTCIDGYGVYKDWCKKCDCGGDINCIFMPITNSEGIMSYMKKCLCPSGYGEQGSMCTGCDCGGEIHNCTFEMSPWVRNQVIKSCVCASGYTSDGEKCKKIDPCVPNPCRNGGKCTFKGSDFNCTCDKLHKGRTCEVEISLCDPNPCRNGGKCFSNGTGYNCTCGKLYKGKNCESRINLCQPNPCQNGGRCIDHGTDYNCTCTEMHKGKNCETGIRVCDPNPCLNGGSCVENGSSFLCKCKDHYSGKICKELDDSNYNVHLELHRLQIINYDWVAIGRNASSNDSIGSTELLNIMNILKKNLMK